jgi:gamma-glutamylcyclotransferase (GGCT)/AIG2-like uncharacterized protein YtfP
LAGHALRFDKPGSMDGTAKCDAAYTGNAADSVVGALYSIDADELALLDGFEGVGHGYERKTVSVVSASNETVQAEIYMATHQRRGPAPARLVQGACASRRPGTSAARRLYRHDRSHTCRHRRR